MTTIKRLFYNLNMVKNITKDENSKARILNAATELFARKGFDGTSIREICKKAGVNICMISYYWGGKQELYEGIIENLIEQQTEYAKSFMDLNKKPADFTKSECIELLIKILEKAADFLYSNKISNDLMVFLLKEQQNPERKLNSPVFSYVRELIAKIFDKDVNDKEIIYKTVFIFSQLNSPRILPAFCLRELGQREFEEDDIRIIKDNIRFYIKAITGEGKVD